MMKRGIAASLCICLLWLMVSAVSAQGESPQSAGNAMREFLFDAQGALMSDNSAAAVEAVEEAQAAYVDTLRETIADVDGDLARTLDANFEDALSAAQSGDDLALAAVRGQLWAGVLRGSSQVVSHALESGDGQTARQWLGLREYRASTKFSRPGADATLAINNLVRGLSDPQNALDAARIDLLDTYQAQLNNALADADQAHERGFTMRRAEEAGLAAGYFDILAADYAGQRGEEALSEAQNAFAALMTSAASDDAAGYGAAREQIDAVLTGFRAAPLSEAEQIRRAGQLQRFIALVPVEYARGVRNGVVTSDIEIQEAVTFRDGAQAAFNDLEVALMGRDAEATAKINDLLAQVQTQINDVADPTALQTSVGEIQSTLTTLLPEEWQNVSADADFDVINEVLNRVETAVKQGQYAQAESARLEAYALLELGMEQRLNGFAPDMAARIEMLFWQGDATLPGLAFLLTTQAPESEVMPTMTALKTALSDAQAYLNSMKSAPEAVAGNAGVIVFREGLEAVLILASLLASLRTLEERKFRRPIIVGAALAFLATGVTWWLAHQLLNVLLPLGERLEAIVSLIAIGVLLLITNWFFHKVYWTGWMANFHAQKRKIIGGIAVVTISQSVGLMILGFTSIYREGFETVLFLQSLVLEAGIGVVMRGVAIGLLATAAVGIVTFALQVRLPYKKMLIVTGVMIGVVLLTMVGHTVHVMQTVGWLPITPISGVYIPFWMGQWFGLFATWQGIGLQIAAAVFVIGSYFLAEHQNSRVRQPSAKRETAAVV
jgi:high-affinity iron transporter